MCRIATLRVGRIVDTPSLKGYTSVNSRLRPSTVKFSTTSMRNRTHPCRTVNRSGEQA